MRRTGEIGRTAHERAESGRRSRRCDQQYQGSGNAAARPLPPVSQNCAVWFDIAKTAALPPAASFAGSSFDRGANSRAPLCSPTLLGARFCGFGSRPIPRYRDGHHNREIVGGAARTHVLGSPAQSRRSQWIFLTRGDRTMHVWRSHSNARAHNSRADGAAAHERVPLVSIEFR